MHILAYSKKAHVHLNKSILLDFQFYSTECIYINKVGIEISMQILIKLELKVHFDIMR